MVPVILGFNGMRLFRYLRTSMVVLTSWYQCVWGCLLTVEDLYQKDIQTYCRAEPFPKMASVLDGEGKKSKKQLFLEQSK